MGYTQHHAIVVTSWKAELLDVAWVEAKRIFGTKVVTEILPPAINGFRSFLVGPDGSKEGWDASDDGDLRRTEFIRWLDVQRYEDGSSSLAWVEVMYGDDDGESSIVREVNMSRGEDGGHPTASGTETPANPKDDLSIGGSVIGWDVRGYQPRGWQPIATAPKDGTVIVVVGRLPSDPPNVQRACVTRWSEHWNDTPAYVDGGWIFMAPGYAGSVDPTHWIPLPSPPSVGRLPGDKNP